MDQPIRYDMVVEYVRRYRACTTRDDPELLALLKQLNAAEVREAINRLQLGAVLPDLYRHR